LETKIQVSLFAALMVLFLLALTACENDSDDSSKASISG
jgi:hypothetical protein